MFVSATIRKVADMAGGNHGAETQEEQPRVSSKNWEKAIAERDGITVELKAQAAEQLRNQIVELKAQIESDRIDFKLQLADACNVKAARAAQSIHGGDVDALKETEPRLFTDVPTRQQGNTTGFPNAGTSTDAGRS